MKIKKLEQHLTKFTNGSVMHYTHSHEINTIEGEHIVYLEEIPNYIEKLLINNSNPKLFILNWDNILKHNLLRNGSTQK